MADPKTKQGAAKSENEGEGSKTADKSYREAATRFAQNHDTAKEAKRAEREVESSPDEYAKAERAGKSRSAGELPSDKDKI